MTVNDAIHKIRDTVNEAVFVHNIQRHGFLWDMVCASMDTVEDTQMAIEAYHVSKNGDVGQHYLEMYGLFQGMFMQQDALVKLAKGLKLDKINVWANDDSKYIREIRNKYFGHPTEKQDKETKQTTYHGIARMSVGTSSLQGWTYPNFQTEDINISEALKKHGSATEKTLESILKDLIVKGEVYMSKFTEDLPTSDHDYEFQKLYMWALGSHTDGIMAKASVGILDKELGAIKTGVTARYDDTERVGDIMREIAKAEYCLSVIKNGMASSKTDSKTDFNFEAHIDSLKQAYEGIIGICKEINTEFGTPPKQ